MYPARVDEKGRLKLPVGFQEYLNSQAEKKLFVTSVDRSSASIYPISLWRVTEKDLWETEGDESEAAENVYFTSQEFGAEAEMDGQGRVLLSPELRRELGIENQPVKVVIRKGVIEVMNEAAFGAGRGKASRDPGADVRALRRKKIL